MAKNNKILLAGVGLGAAFLLTRHESKIQKTDLHFNTVEETLEDHEYRITDVEGRVDYIEERYGEKEEISSYMPEECRPIDATAEVGRLWVSEGKADYRVYMRFQNLNKYQDLVIELLSFRFSWGNYNYEYSPSHGGFFHRLTVKKNTKSTNWILIRSANNNSGWFGYDTVGKIMENLYGRFWNNRRGHFYPITIEVRYQVKTDVSTAPYKWGATIIIPCEIMEEAVLADASKDITHTGSNYFQPKSSPNVGVEAHLTKEQLIKDYRNEVLWNPAFAKGNWFRPDVDGQDYRYPHYNTLHPDYNDGLPKVELSVDSYPTATGNTTNNGFIYGGI